MLAICHYICGPLDTRYFFKPVRSWARMDSLPGHFRVFPQAAYLHPVQHQKPLFLMQSLQNDRVEDDFSLQELPRITVKDVHHIASLSALCFIFECVKCEHTVLIQCRDLEGTSYSNSPLNIPRTSWMSPKP